MTSLFSCGTISCNSLLHEIKRIEEAGKAQSWDYALGLCDGLDFESSLLSMKNDLDPCQISSDRISEILNKVQNLDSLSSKKAVRLALAKLKDLAVLAIFMSTTSLDPNVIHLVLGYADLYE